MYKMSLKILLLLLLAGELLWALKVDELAISPSKKMTAFVYDDGTVGVYSLDNGKRLQRFEVPQNSIFDHFFFSKDNSILNAYTDEGKFSWDIESGQKANPLFNLNLFSLGDIEERSDKALLGRSVRKRIRNVMSIDELAINPKNQTIWVSNNDEIVIWSSDAKRELAHLSLKSFNLDKVGKIAINKSATYIALVLWLKSDRGVVLILEANGYKVHQLIEPQSGVTFDMKFIDEDRLLLNSSFPIEVWDIKKKKLQLNFLKNGSDTTKSYKEILKDAFKPYHVGGKINGLDVNKNGELVVTGTSENLRSILFDKQGRLKSLYPNNYTTGYDVRLSPDGSKVAFGYHGEHLLLYETETGKLIKNHDIGGVPSAIRIIKFSPSGRYLATGSDGDEVTIIDMETQKVVKAIDLESGIYSLIWLNEKELVAGTLSNLFKIEWQSASKKVLLEKGVTALDIFRNGETKLLAVGVYEGKVQILDSKFKSIMSLEHEGVGRISFSKDGKHLVTSSEEATKIWSTHTYQAKVCKALDESIWAMAYDSLHQRIYTAGEEGVVYVWDENCKEVKE